MTVRCKAGKNEKMCWFSWFEFFDRRWDGNCFVSIVVFFFSFFFLSFAPELLMCVWLFVIQCRAMHVYRLHILRNKIKQPNTKWQFLRHKINNQVIITISIENKQICWKTNDLYAHWVWFIMKSRNFVKMSLCMQAVNSIEWFFFYSVRYILSIIK